MKITKVKADNRGGFTVNGKPYTELTEEELTSLSKWFSEGNKAEPLYTPLEKAKNLKLFEIKAAKKAKFDEDVQVKIGAKTVTIFGGESAYDKYIKAYDIANRMGVKKGKIVAREGVIEVNEAQMKAVLQALDTKNYHAEIKAGYLRKAVADATDEATVQKIRW